MQVHLLQAVFPDFLHLPFSPFLPLYQSSPPLVGPQITADLLSNGIDVYPQKEFDEDSEDRLVNEKFRVSAPTRLLFPEAPHFPLEDVGGGLSRGPGKQVGWS